jgi:hypothetical protein
VFGSVFMRRFEVRRRDDVITRFYFCYCPSLNKSRAESRANFYIGLKARISLRNPLARLSEIPLSIVFLYCSVIESAISLKSFMVYISCRIILYTSLIFSLPSSRFILFSFHAKNSIIVSSSSSVIVTRLDGRLDWDIINIPGREFDDCKRDKEIKKSGEGKRS